MDVSQPRRLDGNRLDGRVHGYSERGDCPARLPEPLPVGCGRDEYLREIDKWERFTKHMKLQLS